MIAQSKIDYSKLANSLDTKRPISSDIITVNIAKRIWDLFLEKNYPHIQEKRKSNKLNDFANRINNASEEMKIKFALTINHLVNQNLLNSNSIKSLMLKWNSGDEILSNIIDDLINNRQTPLNENEKSKLNEAIAEWIQKHYFDLVRKKDNSEQLQQKVNLLEEQLRATEDELTANENIVSMAESAVLTRRSTNNTIRIASSIERILKNKKWLDDVTVARKVLWQAKHFTIFGSWKRFDRTSKLRWNHNIKDEYTNILENLIKKSKNTKSSKEKIAIMYIKNQVEKAYNTYIKEMNIDQQTRDGLNNRFYGTF